MIDVLRIILFLLLVNGLPPLVAVLTRNRFDWAVDGGTLWRDGRPLFGNNKTFRGLVAASAGGALAFPLLGQPFWVAGTAAILAMTGDLFSSFVKRRLTLENGRNIAGLDQLFESLFPLLFLDLFFTLSLLQKTAVLLLFTIVAYYSSRFWQHLTEGPLPAGYPRVVRSNVRYREWKACHTPLAKWQVWFNLSSFLSDQVLLTLFFKLTGLYTRGENNALEIRLEEQTFYFHNLPDHFDGFSLLLLTDLHLDGLHGITAKLKGLIDSLTVDLCLVGGDIRMKTYGETSRCMHNLHEVMRSVQAEQGTFGVLGNHDCIEMLPPLEDAGIVMLVNDSMPIERQGRKIWLIGVDDPHYYRLHDGRRAAAHVPQDSFSIYLAHSPEALEDAAGVQASLYLCGHTHGGQICLGDGTPIITNSRAPRHTASGRWRYGNMQGYTSRGVGPSSIPVRFNCPGEVSLITLRKG